MTKADILTILKSDLDIAITSTSKDTYLENLIDLSISAITREGITLSDPYTAEEGTLVEMYAAFLFRRRKDAGTSSRIHDSGFTMPRSLRYQLNNLLLSQKAAPNNE